MSEIQISIETDALVLEPGWPGLYYLKTVGDDGLEHPDPKWWLSEAAGQKWGPGYNPTKTIGNVVPMGMSAELRTLSRPSAPKFKLNVSYAGKQTSVEIRFQVPWDPLRPYLAEGEPDTLSWDDAKGMRAAQLILTASSEMLPSWFYEVVHSPLPVYRVKDEPRPGHPKAAFNITPEGRTAIVMYDSIVRTLPDKDTLEATRADEEFIYSFLHEAGHALLAFKSGGPETVLQMREMARLRRETAWKGGLGFGWIGLVPLWPATYAKQLKKNLVYDFTSEWCKATGWRINNTSLSTIPLLGLVLWHFSEDDPNYATAHVDIGRQLGLRNAHLRGNGWFKAGMCRENSTLDPHEDFADCIAAAVIGTGKNALRPGVRRTFLKNNGVLPPVPKKPHSWLGFEIAWKTDRWKPKRTPSKRPKASAMSENAIESDSASDTDELFGGEVAPVLDGLSAWAEGPATVIAKVRDTLIGLEIDVDEPTVFDLCRTMAMHGSGLQPFTPQAKVEVGEVLVSRRADMFLVTQVDEDGHAAQVTGWIEGKERYDEDDIKLSFDDIALRWTPAGAKRDFGTATSPLFSQVNETMPRVLTLWGREEWEGQTFDEPSHFFRALVDVAGIRRKGDRLSTQPTIDDVRAYAAAHGSEFTTAANESRIACGGIVLLSTGALGMVVAVHENLDVLLVGQEPPGQLGEPESVPRLVHDVERSLIELSWTPV